eukprot:gene42853-53170_t
MREALLKYERETYETVEATSVVTGAESVFAEDQNEVVHEVEMVTDGAGEGRTAEGEKEGANEGAVQSVVGKLQTEIVGNGHDGEDTEPQQQIE